MIESIVEPELAQGTCPHMAALVRNVDELPGLLASFYALGAARNGWLVHRALPGAAQADRAMLSTAGLDVAGLEASGRLTISEVDPDLAPADWVRPWDTLLDEQLRRGFDALWYSRFPVGPDESVFLVVVPFEQAWVECFTGRRAVSLCPFVVGDLEPAEIIDRAGRVSGQHDLVLEARADGVRRVTGPASDGHPDDVARR